ncbi:hypothetical protein [Devosia sediminis]|uniref:HNH endonuclease n=1 Tax=Devosia sediminis TaxID=2798801 RepID=A0A934IZV6_9HYPH|nr:hypothetical protein [Devosia sediminis]MBJ3785743.1 hypothetical protein [Devosia sediminis]
MSQKLGKRSRSRAEVMSRDGECIYCGQPTTHQEHMPPIGMFRKRDRASGMEFATCAACNNGTSAADLVASFMARIDANGALGDWRFQEAFAQRNMLMELAPGFLAELLSPARVEPVLLNTNGVLTRQAMIKADGPLTKAYLDVFSAKLGMALYREHTDSRLPDHGGVQAWWYLNFGLAIKDVEQMLSIMPLAGRLAQGRKTSDGQFNYRCNTDNKSIVVALVSFHDNLHVSFAATSDPQFYNLPFEHPRARFTKPGQIAGMMPKVTPSQLIMLPGLGGAPYTSLRIPARRA